MAAPERHAEAYNTAPPPLLFGAAAAVVAPAAGVPAAAASAASPPPTPTRMAAATAKGGDAGTAAKRAGTGGHAASRAHRNQQQQQQQQQATAAQSPAAAAAASSASSSSSSLLVDRASWQIDPSELLILRDEAPVGEGFFGAVYKARWREMTVCAKLLKNVRAGEAANFAKEVHICAQLRHPHLVQFLAACTRPGHLSIVTEWMTGGSLYSWLHEGSRVGGVRYRRAGAAGAADMDTLMRLAIEIARGLVYLVSQRIVHRDLTSSNILLTENLLAKVADFGLSRADAGAATSGVGGNLLYLAPESFLSGRFTEASDVFAFGVVLSELITGQVPYKGISPALAASECANRGARPSLASSTPVGLARLICACWSHEPAARPTFRQVLQNLEALRAEMNAERRAQEATETGAATTGSAAAEMATASGYAPVNSTAVGTSGSISGNHSGGASSKRGGKKIQPSLQLQLQSSQHSSSEYGTVSVAPLPSPQPKSGKSSRKAAAAAAAVTFASPAAESAYHRPLTPEQDEGDDAHATGAATDSGSAQTSAISSAPPHPKGQLPLISATPSVSAKDVRLFLLCLKKLLPSHDAFLETKPRLDPLDVLCEGNVRPGAAQGHNSSSSGGSGSGASKLFLASSIKAGSEGLLDTHAATGSNTSTSGVLSPFRSRSEGDDTTASGDTSSMNGSSSSSDDTRPHACGPAFVSGMYRARVPRIGELVICKARRADDMGAQYELVEYAHGSAVLLGMAPMQELTRRKMRSIHKLVVVGSLDVLRVLHVDPTRGYADLSKKDVNESLRSACLTYFRQAEAAHAVVLAAAKMLNRCSYCLYSQLVWPLASRFDGSVHQMLRVALVNPLLSIGEFHACACTQQVHRLGLPAAAASAAAGADPATPTTPISPTNASRAAAITATPFILPSPRVLPEVSRRCSFHPLHLNLSRLALDALPLQLVPPIPATSAVPDIERQVSGETDSGAEGESQAAVSSASAADKDKEKKERRRGGRSGNSRRSSSAAPATNSGGASEEKKSLYTHLRSLNIEENPLGLLPPRMGSFRRMQELNVNCCSLATLPLSLAQCPLQRLYAFGNLFESVPAVVRQLVDLSQLNLSANRIAKLDVADLSPLSNLIELSLAHNLLEHIVPHSLPPAVEVLDLSYCRFARFPEQVWLLPNLVSLEIKHNAIPVLPAPPPSALTPPPLAFLEWLDCSHNKLTSVHDDLFARCTNVAWLNLSSNQLDTLPRSVFSLLREDAALPSPPTVGPPLASDEGKQAATTMAVVGLNYLNISKNRFKAGSIEPEQWARLSARVHQFLFDTAAAPPKKSSRETTFNAASAAAAQLLVPPIVLPPSSPVAKPSLPPMSSWSTAQVALWLRSVGAEDGSNGGSLAEFAPAFEENLIAGETLVELDKSDLRDLGVTKLGQQKQLLKFIMAHKERDAAVAAAAAAASRASQQHTPASTSVHGSPTLQGLSRTHSGGGAGAMVNDMFGPPLLNLGAKAIDNNSPQPPGGGGGPPPSVAIRRVNSSGGSPSTNAMSPPPGGNGGVGSGGASMHIGGSLSLAAVNGTAPANCDPRHCESIKSALLHCAVHSVELCKPVLLRCVIVLLIGSVFSVEEARDTLARAVQAGQDAAAKSGGAVCTPFHGMYGGCTRAALSISPLLEPLYALSAPCLLPSDGTALLEAATGAMSLSLARDGKGGRVKIAVRPYIVEVLPGEQDNLMQELQLPESADAATLAAAASSSVLPPPSSPSSASVPASLRRTSSHTSSSSSSSSARTSSSSAAALDGGEFLAAFAAFKAAKEDEATERAARKAEQQQQHSSSGEKKRKKREGERGRKEREPTGL